MKTGRRLKKIWEARETASAAAYEQGEMKHSLYTGRIAATNFKWPAWQPVVRVDRTTQESLIRIPALDATTAVFRVFRLRVSTDISVQCN